MKKISRKCLALLTTLAMLFSWAIPVYAAGEICQVQYDVTYGQTEARTMLAMINDFRTGSDAWYWDESDTTKVSAENLQPLTYDYELEKVAMQRAAEIAINFAHDRPDGTECWTAYHDVGINCENGENIAVGSPTAQRAFELWQETDEPYAGQGHRRNMLSSSSQTVAVGHVVYKGTHFWVQEFGKSLVGGTETPANDDVTTATVNVSADQVTQKTVQAPAPITLELDQGTELPLVNVTMTLTGSMDSSWGITPQVEAQASWQDDPNGIVKVEGNQVTALKAGTTTLTGTVLGEAVALEVTVNAASLEGAAVTLDQPQFTVTGSEIQPAVTVTLDGKTLTEGVDYTVTYANNKEIGTATVTVTGTGNYTGTAQTTFAIVDCTHQWDEGKVTTPATCTTEGVKTYTCALCGVTRTEGIAALGHDWDEWQTTKEPTCTEAGEQTRTCPRCNETETQPVDALGHTWDAGVMTKEPLCDEDGVMTYTCTVCQETKTEPIAMKGHTPMTIPGMEPTCTVAGRSDGSECSVCGALITAPQEIPALGHDWDEGVVTKPATCTEAGEKTYHCNRCHAFETRDTDPTGHSWDEGVVTTPATCTEAGEKTYTCTVCQETKTEPIPALGHDWDEGVVTKEPTCTEDGAKLYTCQRCSETNTGTIPATGHSYEESWSRDGTNHWRVCQVCGARGEEAAHSWEWVVDQEPNGTQAGKQHQECTVCGARGGEETILTATVPNGEPGKEYRVHVADSQPAEAVKDTLTQAAETRLPANAVNSKTAFYEVELQHRESGGEWQSANAAGMQITVTLLYPAGTNGTDYDFIVTHLMANGTVEHPAAVETVDGLLVTFQGLSPVSVTAYQQKASNPVTTPDETENDPDDNPEQTQTNNQSNPATPVPATPTPAPAPSENGATVPAAAPTAAPQSAIPATADSFPLALWVVLFAAGTCGLIALVVMSRRRDG